MNNKIILAIEEEVRRCRALASIEKQPVLQADWNEKADLLEQASEIVRESGLLL